MLPLYLHVNKKSDDDDDDDDDDDASTDVDKRGIQIHISLISTVRNIQ